MRKPAFSICENKGADQLRGNREADQRLSFRYIDSTIPLLSKSEISSLLPSCVAVQPGLCGTWSETLKTGFLTTRLILGSYHQIPTFLLLHSLQYCQLLFDAYSKVPKFSDARNFAVIYLKFKQRGQT